MNFDLNKFGPGHCPPAGQPVLSNLHARGTKAHAMPQDKDTTGLQTKWYTSVLLPPHLSASFLSS